MCYHALCHLLLPALTLQLFGVSAYLLQVTDPRNPFAAALRVNNGIMPEVGTREQSRISGSRGLRGSPWVLALVAIAVFILEFGGSLLSLVGFRSNG